MYYGKVLEYPIGLYHVYLEYTLEHSHFIGTVCMYYTYVTVLIFVDACYLLFLYFTLKWNRV